MSHAILGHMLAHMILRGLVYGLIWKVLHHLTLPETLVLVAAAIALFWFFGKAGRSRAPWGF